MILVLVTCTACPQPGLMVVDLSHSKTWHRSKGCCCCRAVEAVNKDRKPPAGRHCCKGEQLKWLTFAILKGKRVDYLNTSPSTKNYASIPPGGSRRKLRRGRKAGEKRGKRKPVKDLGAPGRMRYNLVRSVRVFRGRTTETSRGPSAHSGATPSPTRS